MVLVTMKYVDEVHPEGVANCCGSPRFGQLLGQKVSGDGIPVDLALFPPEVHGAAGEHAREGHGHAAVGNLVGGGL